MNLKTDPFAAQNENHLGGQADHMLESPFGDLVVSWQDSAGGTRDSQAWLGFEDPFPGLLIGNWKQNCHFLQSHMGLENDDRGRN